MSDVQGGPGGRDEPREPAADDASRRAGEERADEERAGAGSSTPVTQQLGRIALVAIAVLFLVFAFANAQHVDFSWLVGETRVTRQGGDRISGGVPLIVLMLASFVAGAAVASLVAWQRGRRKGR